MKTFTDWSIEKIIEKKSVLCVGLDPQLERMPPHLIDEMRRKYGGEDRAYEELLVAFNTAIIDAVADTVPWVKPQLAFYEEYGSAAVRAYERTMDHARWRGLLAIADGKRGDGGDTVDAYADGHIGTVPWWPDAAGKFTRCVSPIRADALTVNGYIADACLSPFIQRVKEYGTGIFVVDKTSFKPNSEVEQLRTMPDGQLWERFTSLLERAEHACKQGFPDAVAALVAAGKEVVAASETRVWEQLAAIVGRLGEGTEGERGWRNVGVVMGATYPEDVPKARAILPNTWLLKPGYGAQGGGADGAVAGADEDGFGVTVNSSRDIIYAWNGKDKRFNGRSEDFAACARAAAIAARDDLNAALLRAGKGRAFLGG